MTTDDTRTDTDAAVELAAQPIPFALVAGQTDTLALPPNWELIGRDGEKLLANRRSNVNSKPW